VIDFFANKALGVTTNVVGPRRRRRLAGVPVDGVLGWVPGSGTHTVGVCIFTYAGTVRVGVVTDAALVPDPERLVAAFEAELGLLASLAAPTPPPEEE
ncbi:MAG TPA: WS/DGAT domain-containing protein, partial [Ornithinibacter sp.]|nr:WS/DGAT domain-containing protein [Ornithinibacter sp.]